MSESESGLDVMRSRMQRASRKPPSPRGTKAADKPVPASPPRAPRPPAAKAARTAAPPVKSASAPDQDRLAPDTPSVNLAIRVRRPLDDRLMDLIHDLRRGSVRTSKVELVEMLLWELPESAGADLRQRLAAFRAAAPRVGSADTDI